MQTDVLDELLNTDDMDKNASSEAKMQRAMDYVSQSCDKYDLTISTKIQRLYTKYNESTITVNEQKLKVFDKFTYEALSPEQCTLMMRLLPALQQPVWHSEDSKQMSGSKKESSLTSS